MKQIEIAVPQEVSSYIQSIGYELDARRDIITYLMQQNGSPITENANFALYHDEYKEYKIEFEMAKKQLEADYVLPAIGTDKASWELDYNTCTLAITIYEEV